jgi:glycosyltransferase involved in cell wall biosynthesis
VRTPVSVVPTGVDLALFSPGSRERARRRLGLPAADLICLYTGRLDREKSLERVLDAFESIAAAVSSATLHLVGKGSHDAALRARASASRAGRRIVFHGGLDRGVLPDYYRAADLFLFASETETQGLVLAEAHACALPAVAIRASGVDEVVTDGETGFLTKGDTRDMADAAIGLLLDGARRAAMGVAARRLAEARFSTERQIEAMVGHYRALIDGAR